MSDLQAAPVPLTDYRVLAARGPDARKFLQGQLSQDVLTLAVGDARRASLNTPQGRCLVILDVVADNDTDLLCITTAAQASTLSDTLKRYVLRSKVRLDDETAHYALTGLWAPPAAAAAMPDSIRPDSIRPDSTTSSTVAPSFMWPHSTDGRYVQMQRVDPTTPRANANALALEAWHRADVAAGLPRLASGTQGEFVAQMLNLDVLEGISFKKGCYTGQEVIARAHFRGRVKRRLQRFRLSFPTDTTPVPGQSITLSDGRSASLVDAVRDSSPDLWQCLAVTTFDGPPLPEALPLPYALPQ